MKKRSHKLFLFLMSLALLLAFASFPLESQVSATGVPGITYYYNGVPVGTTGGNTGWQQRSPWPGTQGSSYARPVNTGTQSYALVPNGQGGYSLEAVQKYSNGGFTIGNQQSIPRGYHYYIVDQWGTSKLMSDAEAALRGYRLDPLRNNGFTGSNSGSNSTGKSKSNTWESGDYVMVYENGEKVPRRLADNKIFNWDYNNPTVDKNGNLVFKPVVKKSGWTNTGSSSSNWATNPNWLTQRDNRSSSSSNWATDPNWLTRKSNPTYNPWGGTSPQPQGPTTGGVSYNSNGWVRVANPNGITSYYAPGTYNPNQPGSYAAPLNTVTPQPQYRGTTPQYPQNPQYPQYPQYPQAGTTNPVTPQVGYYGAPIVSGNNTPMTSGSYNIYQYANSPILQLMNGH